MSAETRDVTDSAAFTNKLEALLRGDSTVDMDVGNTRLVNLIRSLPPLLDERN